MRPVAEQRIPKGTKGNLFCLLLEVYYLAFDIDDLEPGDLRTVKHMFLDNLSFWLGRSDFVALWTQNIDRVDHTASYTH